jgi:Zn-dependent oligopeptidase
MDPDGVVDPDRFERETLTRIGMPKELVMRHRLPQFNHLFSSDAYSAGYYSYLWSETMDADTWAAFEEAGSPWDKATATRFRKTLLETGNETDRAEAYQLSSPPRHCEERSDEAIQSRAGLLHFARNGEPQGPLRRRLSPPAAGPTGAFRCRCP